jgi:hypothetical protein
VKVRVVPDIVLLRLFDRVIVLPLILVIVVPPGTPVPLTVVPTTIKSNIGSGGGKPEPPPQVAENIFHWFPVNAT